MVHASRFAYRSPICSLIVRFIYGFWYGTATGQEAVIDFKSGRQTASIFAGRSLFWHRPWGNSDRVPSCGGRGRVEAGASLPANQPTCDAGLKAGSSTDPAFADSSHFARNDNLHRQSQRGWTSRLSAVSLWNSMRCVEGIGILRLRVSAHFVSGTPRSG